MPSKEPADTEQIILLLKQLLALELWRAGLSQSEIRKRVGLGMTSLSGILKGVSKGIESRTKSDS